MLCSILWGLGHELMLDRLIILRRFGGWPRDWLLLRRAGRSCGFSRTTSVEALKAQWLQIEVCVVILDCSFQ